MPSAVWSGHLHFGLVAPSARRPTLINRLHDFLGPPDCVCDGANRRRSFLSSIELSELAFREDTRCDQQHTFPALVTKQFISFVFCSPSPAQV
jgi:hypothetical protein